MKKERLDVLLVRRGLAESRERAKRTIMAGEVFVDGQREDKAGSTFPEDVEIEVRGRDMPYVSRGGFKLERALSVFPIDLNDRTCMDVGSSTGGFTDCMLQNGAAHVYAIDVGTNQLAWKLRQDPRVVCLERTNARYLTREVIPDPLDFFSMDVSFISVKLILPALLELLAEGGEGVILIKPQFEAGKEAVSRGKGVIRDEKVHRAVLEDLTSHLEQSGFGILDLTYSPIKGPKGNIEFLAYVKKGAESAPYDTGAAVSAAHQELDGVRE